MVKETVNVLDKMQLGWAKGFINGALRTFCRDRERILSELEARHQEEFIYGHPIWLLNLFKVDWPEHWVNIVQGNDAHPPLSLRVNLKKISRIDYLHKLQQWGLELQQSGATKSLEVECHMFSPAGFTLATACTVTDLPGFGQGEISVQDEAAQFTQSSHVDHSRPPLLKK